MAVIRTGSAGTVQQRVRRARDDLVGDQLARILVRRIDGDTAGDRERVFSATIVHRGSVGPPPSG